MKDYTYTTDSMLNRVNFQRGQEGSQRAYLFASDNAKSADLLNIATQLHNAGLQTIPLSNEQGHSLEVRGFRSESSLLSTLSTKGFISGTPQVKQQEETQSFTDKVKKRSLFASALFYVIGDIKFFSYGLKGASPLNMAAGVSYGLGTASSLFFGRKGNSDLRVHDVAQQMADHMNSLDIKLPPEASLNRILDEKHKGNLQKADDYFRHFPAELMNSFIAMAGVCIALAAAKQLKSGHLPDKMVDEYLKKNFNKLVKEAGEKGLSSAAHDIRARATTMLTKHHHAANWLDVGLGTVSLASGSFGALVKEKKRDPDVPAKEGLAGVWEKIQERPLTITGIGLMASTMCHAVSTAIEYRIGTTDGKSAIFDRGLFVASNLVAEFLIMISSKGHGQGVTPDPSTNDSAISIAAELIACKPKEEQKELTHYMAKFLGRADVLALDDVEVENRLAHEIAAIYSNPWAQATCAPIMKQQSSAPALTKKSGDVPAWQAKIAATDSLPLQPSL